MNIHEGKGKHTSTCLYQTDFVNLEGYNNKLVRLFVFVCLI